MGMGFEGFYQIQIDPKSIPMLKQHSQRNMTITIILYAFRAKKMVQQHFNVA